ncbi:helix-turn-helix transcriptional regulator [Candidatus Haliotispira prima]|uniref:Helix-turn-helix transcriptional regulator n=1 Tax=Candidatus Haliotispira prima TaxID=3034016 RepID=A0ABY8MGN9_9SPIO|nr:helix-turn-helix transcriptional regulator [Candidatus Haliotispira prima]
MKEQMTRNTSNSSTKAPGSEEELRLILKDNIKRLRKARSMSQENLAEAAGLSIAYVGGIEIAIKSPSLQSLCSIARALQVEVHQLLRPQFASDITDDEQQVFCNELSRELQLGFKQLLEQLLKK